MNSREQPLLEIEGRVCLSELPPGVRLELDTGNHRYSLMNLGNGRVQICGHPEYCPEPTEVALRGSYLSPGMRLEFWHPNYNLVATSRIVDIRLIP